MNITLDIPVKENFRPLQLEQLQEELTKHALLWIQKFVSKNTTDSVDLQVMPREFEALCGSVSLKKIEEERKNDPMLDALMEKYK